MVQKPDDQISSLKARTFIKELLPYLNKKHFAEICLLILKLKKKNIKE